MRNRKPYEFDALATFNSERARGIVHTPEWCEQMAAEQAWFVAQREAEWAADPRIVVIPRFRGGPLAKPSDGGA